MMMRMEYFNFNLQSKSNLGYMVEEEEEEEAHNHSSNEMDSISSSSSVASLDSDLADDVTSSASSSASSSSISGQQPGSGSDPLHHMADLLQQLPIKRGLSKHFQGKSQSFTSLSNVRCLEDLAKPENPFMKKMKSCKSYAAGLSDQSHRLSGSSSSRLISKKTSSSRGSCSSLAAGAGKRSGTGSNKPPAVPPPCRSASTNSFSNQTPLFA